MYGIDVSNYVSSFNTAFYFIVVISAVILAGLTFAIVYFIFKYNKKKNSIATQIEGNLTLEILWTVIPLIISLAMFQYGWVGWKPINNPPKDAMEVTSVARMWDFNFIYENGKNSPDLVVPVNKPVNIKLVSLDVIHSIFIPAFRIKSDIIPGREKIMWFLPQVAGEYDLYCAEYCGLRHSYMNAMVRVLPVADYEKWYADTTSVVLAEAGESPGSAGMEIIRTQGCNACHSSDGSKIIGPTFLNFYGKSVVVIRDNKEFTVTADDEYIIKSILDPNSEIVKGYQPNLMQTYKGVVNDEQINLIIEYLKTLNEE